MNRPTTGRQHAPRPPTREVSEQEIRDNEALVHFVIRRMYAKGTLRPEIEYDDAHSTGMLGLWEALRRWDPERAELSTYCSSYIWGYVMTHQRSVMRATGWSRRGGGRVAHVASLERELAEDFTLHDKLACDRPTEDVAHWSREAKALLTWIRALPPRQRTVARRRFLDEAPLKAVADELGVTTQRVSQIEKRLRAAVPQSVREALAA